jgi:hypothetical protein
VSPIKRPTLFTGALSGKRLWSRIFILDLAYISRNIPSPPGFFPESEEISAPPPFELEYIYFMKIGQPKLSERKGQRGELAQQGG